MGDGVGVGDGEMGRAGGGLLGNPNEGTREWDGLVRAPNVLLMRWGGALCCRIWEVGDNWG